MTKVFIFSVCSECGEPIDIISPCNELGYNNFPTTNFHGELSTEKTEELRIGSPHSLHTEKINTFVI